MSKADLIVKGVSYIMIDKEACFSVASLKKKKIEFGYQPDTIIEEDGKEYVKYSDLYFD